MTAQLPYCGSPPVPGELLTRLNLDPILIFALLALLTLHLRYLRRVNGAGGGARLASATVGWLVAAAALISPLCALSVSLFAARVGQHMLLVLVAAPLLAYAWPRRHSAPVRESTHGGWRMWAPTLAFFLALWFWHMPDPYDATFRYTFVYWCMHVTLFGSGILLWRVFLHHPPGQAAEALAVGALTSMQMSLLGAVLTFAGRPLFAWHLLSMTGAWGVTPLQDQQLGGAFMWVPGMLLFVWVAIRSFGRLWNALEGVKTA
jgi:putative membrane protein